MGLFFYTKIGSIIFIGDLPTTNIIEPKNLAIRASQQYMLGCFKFRVLITHDFIAFVAEMNRKKERTKSHHLKRLNSFLG